MNNTITQKDRNDALKNAIKKSHKAKSSGDQTKENKAANHRKLVSIGYIHKDSKKLEGGRCLERCPTGGYKENCSCSYRWQAVHRATNMDPSMYKLEDPNKQYKRHITANSDNHKTYKSRGYRDATKRDGKIDTTANGGIHMYKRVKPFQTWKIPWENNAHHIVPIGALRDALFMVIGTDAAKLAKPCMDHLMNAPYNVNHWKNMIILPCNEAQGYDLGLPTHPPHIHPEYSRAVYRKLRNIFREAFESDIKAAMEKDKDHKDKELQGDVAKSIVNLQEEIYTRIKMNRRSFRDKYSKSDIKIESFASSLIK